MINEYSDKQILIMDTALRIFSEKGYNGTSVRDIAKAAAVNVAMISYYFGSKENLLEEIFRRRTRAVKLILEKITKNKVIDPFKKVDMLIENYTDLISENRSFHRLMIREQLDAKDGVLFNLVIKLKLHNKNLLENAIKQGQKLGLFHNDVDVSLLVATVIGSINHCFTNYNFIMDAKGIPAEAYEENFPILLDKLKQQLKVMIKAFLTYGVTK